MKRVIGRMKVFAVITDKVEYNVLPVIDDIVYIIAAIVNLSSPVLAANKFEMLFVIKMHLKRKLCFISSINNIKYLLRI